MQYRLKFLNIIGATLLLSLATTLQLTSNLFTSKALAQAITNTDSPLRDDDNQRTPTQAQTTEDKKAQADRLYKEGIELLRQRQLQQAAEKFQKVLAIRKELRDDEGQMKASYVLGSIYEQLGQNNRAQEYYPPASESLKPILRTLTIDPEEERLIAEELEQIGKQIKNQAARLYQRGIQQLSKGQLQQALQTFQQVLAIHRELESQNLRNESGKMKAFSQIAIIYELLGQSDRAQEYYQQARTSPTSTEDLATLRSRGNAQRDEDEDPKTRAARLFREGSQQLEKGQFQVALATFQQVLGIRKKLADRKGEAEALFQLGKVHERMGNKNWAQQFYQRSREIAVR